MSKDREWTWTDGSWRGDGGQVIGFQIASENSNAAVTLNTDDWTPEYARVLARKILECCDLAEGKDPQSRDRVRQEGES